MLKYVIISYIVAFENTIRDWTKLVRFRKVVTIALTKLDWRADWRSEAPSFCWISLEESKHIQFPLKQTRRDYQVRKEYYGGPRNVPWLSRPCRKSRGNDQQYWGQCPENGGLHQNCHRRVGYGTTAQGVSLTYKRAKFSTGGLFTMDMWFWFFLPPSLIYWRSFNKKRWICIAIAVVAVLIVIVVLAVEFAPKSSSSDDTKS